MCIRDSYYCFPPVTYLDKTQLTLIRPMMYIEEKEVKSFTHKMQLPVINNPCPADGDTKRQEIKEWIKERSKDHPYIKKNLYAALLDYYQNLNTNS